jgi:hypothetical protein
MFVFTVFRVTATLAMVWSIVELALGFAHRATLLRVVINGVLTLSMFFFWFLILAATF